MMIINSDIINKILHAATEKRLKFLIYKIMKKPGSLFVADSYIIKPFDSIIKNALSKLEVT